MDTKKLRQKILDLAIHGKLVPQDPNDEPTSVLLERIRSEKEQLIKEGKIKAPKKSKTAGDTSHYPKEWPWELPEGWVWCRLEDLCCFLSRGKSPVYSSESREYPVFAQKCNLKEGGISLDKALFLDPATLPKWPAEYRLKTDDVLINSTGTGTVGRTRLFSDSCLGVYPFVVPDSHVSVVRTFEQIYSQYIFNVLSSDFGQLYFEDNLSGSTNQKELYIGAIADFLIPLPPKEEQPRISEQVKILNAYLEIIDKQKASLESAVESVKTRVLELAIHGKLVSQDSSDEPAIKLLKRINPDFSPSDNLHYEDYPLGWQDVTLKEVTSLYSGRDLEASSCNTEHRGIPYLVGASCIEGNAISVYRWTEYPEVIAKQNDVLLSCKGTVGEVLLNAIGDVHIARQFMAIRSRAPQLILPEYIELIIKASIEELKSAARGIIPGLSREDILEMRAGIPPLAEQKRILLRINEMEVSLSQISQDISD